MDSPQRQSATIAQQRRAGFSLSLTGSSQHRQPRVRAIAQISGDSVSRKKGEKDHRIERGASLGDLLVCTVAKKGPHCDPMLRNVSGGRPPSGSGGRDAHTLSTYAPGKTGATPAANTLALGFGTPQEQQEREEQQREQTSGGGGNHQTRERRCDGGGPLSCTTVHHRAANRDHPAQT